MSTGDNYLKWKQRAKQAENELRALKLSHERLRRECMEADTRAERAEADNAALLSEMKEAHDNTESISGDVFERPHPGAALLERLHVATAYAATGLREHHGHRCGMAGGPHPDNPRECNDAHCRQWAHDLDALKERKP